jgi:hypothetical protein
MSPSRVAIPLSAAPGSPSGVRTVTVTSHGWPPVAAQNASPTSFADASRCSAPLKNTTTCGCAGCRWWRPPCLGRPSAHERTATSCAWQLLASLTAHCSAARPDGESSMPTMMRRSLVLLMDGTSLHCQPHPVRSLPQEQCGPPRGDLLPGLEGLSALHRPHRTVIGSSSPSSISPVARKDPEPFTTACSTTLGSKPGGSR